MEQRLQMELQLRKHGLSLPAFSLTHGNACALAFSREVKEASTMKLQTLRIVSVAASPKPLYDAGRVLLRTN